MISLPVSLTSLPPSLPLSLRPFLQEAVDGYFGNDFTLVDLSTSEFDSVVVGCPLCAADRGAVYVYIHNGSPGALSTRVGVSHTPVIAASHACMKSKQIILYATEGTTEYEAG